MATDGDNRHDLPDPETITSTAIDRGKVSQNDAEVVDPSVINVAVAGTADRSIEQSVTDVIRDDGVYRGQEAGITGRLAATLDGFAEERNACIHYPEPVETAEGPWLVIEPLDGRIATVSPGRGRVRITVGGDNRSDTTGLAATRDAIETVLETARPIHEHYPVETDDSSVFVTGMTTFELTTVTGGGPLEIQLIATTTPVTRGSEIEARFESVPAVDTCTYEPIIGVERSRPTDTFREVIETAHRTVTEDAVYEWLRQPTVFSRIPTARKMAIGTGTTGDDSFGAAAYDRCRRILETISTEWEAVR